MGSNAQAGLQLLGAGDLEGRAEAYGGQGGEASNGTDGAGGQASLGQVYAESTNGGTVGVSGGIYGGSGGTGRGAGFSGGAGGNAMALAQGNAPATGSVHVTADASGSRGGTALEGASRGQSGQAQATATGTAGSGTVAATARTSLAYDNLAGEQLVETQAAAPVASTSTAVAKTSEAGPLAGLTDASGLQAAALATVYPESTALNPLLSANPTVRPLSIAKAQFWVITSWDSRRQATPPRDTLLLLLWLRLAPGLGRQPE